jgi:peptidoglycan-N-acetylglucosamine deacetylase
MQVAGVGPEAARPTAAPGPPLRSLIPLPARLALYELSPGRRRRWRAFPALERLPDGRRRVAVTFDDGPGELTPELLRTLDEHGIAATFFLLGEEAERRREVVRSIVEAGHEVALHGSEHLRHDHVPPRRSGADVQRGLDQVEASSGVRPRWYRPPFGKFSQASFRACAELELRPAYWSTWGYDWEPISGRRIFRRVGRDLGPGAVILLHDSARYARRDTARPTIDAVPLIAAALRERNLATVKLSDAVA